MTYQPLALKNKTVRTTDGGETTIKAGTLSHDGQAYEVRLRKTQRGHLVRVHFEGRWLNAGLVEVIGIGRWGVNSFTADSQPYQPHRRDYEQRGTLADSAERVAHEWLNNIEYARAKEQS